MTFEFFLARRYLSHKGRGLSVITWIAVAGVIVGVMSLITVMAVMSGFDSDLRGKILGNNAHILIQLTSPVEPRELQSILQKIQKTEGVDSAMPVIYGEGFVLSPTGQSQGVFLKGVDPDLVDKVLKLRTYLVHPEDRSFTENSGALLGRSLASELNLRAGDSFTLLLNRGEFSPFGVVPKMKKLKILNVFHSGMSQYDQRHIYLPLSLAENLLEASPRSIEVRTKDLRQILPIRKRLDKELGDRALVQDWLSFNKDLFSALKLEKTVMALILALIVLVASFNICGSLIMLVHDKTKDIAILKSMGATDRGVLKIFFLQGMFIGAVGTIVGTILGIAFSFLLRDTIQFPLNKEVYMIDTLPVDLRTMDVLSVIVGALVVSGLATLYPAFLAARIVPTEGLKAD